MTSEADTVEGPNGLYGVPAHVLLDGKSLTPEILHALGYEERHDVDLSPDAWEAVRLGRECVDKMLEDKERVVFGVRVQRARPLLVCGLCAGRRRYLTCLFRWLEMFRSLCWTAR